MKSAMATKTLTWIDVEMDPTFNILWLQLGVVANLYKEF